MVNIRIAIILKMCFRDPPIGKYEKTKGRNDTGIPLTIRSNLSSLPLPLRPLTRCFDRADKNGGVRETKRKDREGDSQPISPRRFDHARSFAFPCPLDKTRAQTSPHRFLFLFFLFFLFFSLLFSFFKHDDSTLSRGDYFSASPATEERSSSLSRDNTVYFRSSWLMVVSRSPS